MFLVFWNIHKFSQVTRHELNFFFHFVGMVIIFFVKILFLLLFELTLYIKIDSCIDSFTQSILSQTPIFSRIIPAGFKAESLSFSHRTPVFHPRYSRSWVPSGSAKESYIRSFDNSLVAWSRSKAWWN